MPELRREMIDITVERSKGKLAARKEGQAKLVELLGGTRERTNALIAKVKELFEAAHQVERQPLDRAQNGQRLLKAALESRIPERSELLGAMPTEAEGETTVDLEEKDKEPRKQKV
ncbi:hypothetical protein AOLI_G00086090 [Acnodon oligacanthus]